MRDWLPEDMKRFRFIEDTFRKHCRSWGYQEVRTPTVEHLHFFTATGTLSPSMLGKVYSFLDWDGWSGERVVLRPDGTIPVARLYIDNLAPKKSAKLCYVTNVFSFEETARDRERWQCGVELLGTPEPAGDAETISLAWGILQELGLKNVEIRLSHAGAVRALVEALKLPDEQEALWDELLAGDWRGLRKASNSPAIKQVLSLLEVTGSSSGFLDNIRAIAGDLPAFVSQIDGFKQVTGLLDSFSYPYQIDLKSLRGFEYYTGTCYRLSVNGRAVAGGGRYNNLLPLLGSEPLPACGFALYADALTAVMPAVERETRQRVLIKGDAGIADDIKLAVSLSGSLHNLGYIAEVDFLEKEPSGHDWLVTVSAGKLRVTNLATGKDRVEASLGEAVDAIVK
ncbi:MAG: HisS family protein [Chloroflexota bacterium]